MSALSPAQTAWFYPIRGILFLLRNPPKPLTTTITHPLSSQSLLPTILKSLALTLVIVYASYRGVDRTLLATGLVTESSPLPSWLRKLSVLIGVVAIVGSVGGAVVGGKVRGAAKGFGQGILIDKLPPPVGKTLEKTGLGKDDEEREAEDSFGRDNDREGSDATGAVTGVLGGVTNGAQNTVKAGGDVVKSVPDKVRNTVKNKSMFWVANRFVVAPLTAFIPVVGPIIFSALTSKSTGESYILPYTAEVDKAQTLNPAASLTGKSTASADDESFPTIIRSFGLVAGILTALPVIGPVFHFSNFVGAALLVADMQKHKLKNTTKNPKSALKSASAMLPGSVACGDKKLL
ncbi:hypothetical protein DFH27DRAFT_533496 [Peziza echinospora]|nr:hypothetical protein DFH27DRAFT_533496 [Peziza echinospora]